MKNTLLDNSTPDLSLKQTLKQCLLNDKFSTIRIATGYWDLLSIEAIYSELKAFLEREGTQMQLLIGKDPYVYSNLLQTVTYKNSSFPEDFIRRDIEELEVKEEYKKIVELLLQYCENGKIQIRIYRENAEGEVQFLHSKCYIFSGDDDSCGIVGSSNFTQKGLEGNAELNYLETDSTRVIASPQPGSSTKGHIYWFNEKWEMSEEWTRIFLEQVIKKTPIGKKIVEIIEKEEVPFTPYEQYIKLLQLQFGDIVNQSFGEKIESYLPAGIDKYNYQIDAVKRCINIMQEHGGFLLGDVVGLGKTIVGTLIIKYFLSTVRDDGREHKVLLITPPAIKSSWKDMIEKFDDGREDKIEPFIDFITTGKINHIVDEMNEEDDDSDDSGDFGEVLQEKNYGLIVIDESHKFRNSDTTMYQSLDELIQTIIANTGICPYIGLLSATPQNNRPNDIKNQIYLFERNRNDSSLKKANSGNIESFFAEVNREYALLISNKSDIAEKERKSRLLALSKRIRDCVLCDILERRTRTDVKKYYKEDMEQQGIVFPEIVGPNELKYIMDAELAQLFFDTMCIIAPTPDEKLQTNDWLKYSRYRAIEFFVDSKNSIKYAGRGNRSASNVAEQLATIMQISLVKRLESSFTAFTQSLHNLRRYTDNMIKMWENDTIFVCPQIDVNKELNIEEKKKKRGRNVTFDDCVNDIRLKIKKLTDEGKNEKGQNAEYKRTDFKSDYITQLREDFQLISTLCDRWAKNSEDPKFDAFKEKLKSELFNPEKNTSGKLVIFSEAIDTVNILARAVKTKGYRPLVITAANRKEMEMEIKANFDAKYTGDWRDDYDVIITTEVLAEGVNLHRANVILNYDTPWNSTRLMQRIGRVNRIGSKEPFVYVYNFMPSAEGDKQINLVRKAHTKLQSFHILFGEDNKIFTDQESVVNYDITKIDIDEESPLQKYVYELKQYKEKHPLRYQQIFEAKGCWEITQSSEGVAYFVVKAPYSASLAVRVENTKGEIISVLDILENMQVAEDTPSVPLPDSWEQLTSRAIKTYNQYFVRINNSRVGDKKTQAIAVIVNLNQMPNLTEKTHELLRNARRLVDRGSFDLIRKLLDLDVELTRTNSLFTLTIEEIEQILDTELGRLVANVTKRQGEPSIILGTIK